MLYMVHFNCTTPKSALCEIKDDILYSVHCVLIFVCKLHVIYSLGLGVELDAIYKKIKNKLLKILNIFIIILKFTKLNWAWDKIGKAGQINLLWHLKIIIYCIWL